MKEIVLEQYLEEPEEWQQNANTRKFVKSLGDNLTEVGTHAIIGNTLQVECAESTQARGEGVIR